MHKLVYELLEPAAVCSSHDITTLHHRPALGCFSRPAIAGPSRGPEAVFHTPPWRARAGATASWE
jgi:hypothetical protein